MKQTDLIVIENPEKSSLRVHILNFHKTLQKIGNGTFSYEMKTFLFQVLSAEEVVASAYCYLQNHVMIIESIFVRPADQKSGHGKRLIDAITEQARQEGTEILVTSTMRAFDSLGFWEKQTFKIVAEIPMSSRYGSLIYLQLTLPP